MATTEGGARHLTRSAAARDMRREAVAAAAACTAGSPDWRFFHGVEAAALDVIHPERTAVHEGSRWLDAEEPSFRAGFLKGTAALASAPAGLRVHVRLPMPDGT